jgi:hypothetical protein
MKYWPQWLPPIVASIQVLGEEKYVLFFYTMYVVQYVIFYELLYSIYVVDIPVIDLCT